MRGFCNRALLVCGVILSLVMPVAANSNKFYSSIVLDADTGRVYYEHSADMVWTPASLTKIMTLYVILSGVQNNIISLNTRFTITRLAARQPPSSMGFRSGTQVSYANALYMIAVKSANDVSVAAAQYYAGSVSAFASVMNREAFKLGMLNTHFVDPSGLSVKGNYTTAHDMALLVSAFSKRFPEFLHIFAHGFFKFRDRYYYSHNPLFNRYRGATGLKTGFLCASGYNMVATARRNGRGVIVVGLGAVSEHTRYQGIAKLLDLGFASNYEGKILPGSSSYRQNQVPLNISKQVCGDTASKSLVVKRVDGDNMVRVYLNNTPLSEHNGRSEYIFQTILPPRRNGFASSF